MVLLEDIRFPYRPKYHIHAYYIQKGGNFYIKLNKIITTQIANQEEGLEVVASEHCSDILFVYSHAGHIQRTECMVENMLHALAPLLDGGYDSSWCLNQLV